jgi:preprotein translocase subunit SecA
MAGRGAHNAVAPEVLAAGGLHVIQCQLNASARIDRQFLGRAGRQGQPGSCETMVALDFPLLQRRLPRAWQMSLSRPLVHRLFARASLRAAQAAEGWSRRMQRARLAQLAQNEERELNFSRWGS